MMYCTTIAYRDTASSAWKDQVTLTLPYTSPGSPGAISPRPHFTAIQHRPRTARKLPLQVRWCAAGAAPGRRLSAWVAWCACQSECAAAECSPDPASAPAAAAHTAHMGSCQSLITLHIADGLPSQASEMVEDQGQAPPASQLGPTFGTQHGTTTVANAQYSAAMTPTGTARGGLLAQQLTLTCAFSTLR